MPGSALKPIAKNRRRGRPDGDQERPEKAAIDAPGLVPPGSDTTLARRAQISSFKSW